MKNLKYYVCSVVMSLLSHAAEPVTNDKKTQVFPSEFNREDVREIFFLESGIISMNGSNFDREAARVELGKFCDQHKSGVLFYTPPKKDFLKVDPYVERDFFDAIKKLAKEKNKRLFMQSARSSIEYLGYFEVFHE
jgi:hypothetical protein